MPEEPSTQQDQAQIALPDQPTAESTDSTTTTTQPDQQSPSQLPDWLSDTRSTTDWQDNGKPDPNKMYQAFKELETKQSDYDTQQSQLTKLQSEHDNLQSYKQTVDSIMNHPELGSSLQKVIDDYESQQARSRYGDNLSPEQLSKFRDLEQQTQELRSWREQQESKALYDQTYSQAKDQLQKIDELAKQTQIPWDEKQQETFISHCVQNKVPANMLEAEFLRHSREHITNYYKSLGEQATRKNLNEGFKNSLPNASTKDSVATSTQDLDEALDSVLNIT